jgi:uncharacterized protein (DUF2336 family)
MQTGQRYAKLLQLASENSSEKRRELLSDVTSLFFANIDNHTDSETELFGDLMTKVAVELDAEVRKELSTLFSHERVPRRLIVALANDVEVKVAGPILTHSKVLTQSDLISVVENRSDAHRMLVTKRDDVGEALSEALVSYGGDQVVESLIRNETASVSPETYDKIVVRAIANPDLQAPLVERKSISPEHLNQLFLSVGADMRKQILARNTQFSEDEINLAIERAKTRVAVIHGALPGDFEAATRDINNMRAKGSFAPAVLPTLWRDNKKTQFTLAFAKFSELDYNQAAKLFDAKDIDAIAMVSRAAGFDRALFVTIAVLVLGEAGMGKAKIMGDMYNKVPPEAAQRAMRFMKLRVGAMAQAA